MGGSSTKEENAAHTHGNQLVTIIDTQDMHSEEHKQHATLLTVIIITQIVIVLTMLTYFGLKIMKRKWLKKGMKTAQSIATISSNV